MNLHYRGKPLIVSKGMWGVWRACHERLGLALRARNRDSEASNNACWPPWKGERLEVARQAVSQSTCFRERHTGAGPALLFPTGNVRYSCLPPLQSKEDRGGAASTLARVGVILRWQYDEDKKESRYPRRAARIALRSGKWGPVRENKETLVESSGGAICARVEMVSTLRRERHRHHRRETDDDDACLGNQNGSPIVRLE